MVFSPYTFSAHIFVYQVLLFGFVFLVFFFFAALLSLRDLSSPTRDQTQALGNESAES